MRIRELQRVAFTNSKAHGFHDEPTNIPEKLCLIHEEISEALGEYRAGRLGLWWNGAKPEGLGVELADAMIRICDLAALLGIDLEELIAIEHEYNVGRPHKHGKVC